MFGMFKKDIYQGNYSGEVRNDLAHGFGKIEFKDGSSYEGGFLFDEYHGEGKFIFSDEGFIGITSWFKFNRNGKVLRKPFIYHIKNQKFKIIN